MAADGLGQRDDCHAFFDAMDILQGLRFHMPGQQWQMLDDMVAGKLRADTAPGHAACSSSQTWSRSWQASKMVLLKRENRSLEQVVCRLRGLVRRLRVELQATIDASKDFRAQDAEARACCPQGDRARSGKFGWRIQMCVAAERRPRWSRCSGRSS